MFFSTTVPRTEEKEGEREREEGREREREGEVSIRHESRNNPGANWARVDESWHPRRRRRRRRKDGRGGREGWEREARNARRVPYFVSNALERASKISAAKEVSGYRPIGSGQ